MFLRAKMFRAMGHKVYIAALNWRANYPEVFRETCEKHGVTDVEFISPFEFYCGSNPFEAVFAHAGNIDGGGSALQRVADGLKRTLIDGQGRAYRSKHIKDTLSKETVRAVYYDPNSGEPFLVADSDEMRKASRIVWLRAKEGEPYYFPGQVGFYSYWISKVEESLGGAIYIIEQHATNDIFVRNPYLSHRLRTVAVIHSTFFDAPYTYGSPMRRYYARVLKQMNLYDAVIALTEQERDHIFNYFGPREHVYRIANPISFYSGNYSFADKTPNTLVVVNRLVGMKRIDHVIRAMAIIVRECPDAQLHVYGEGDAKDELMVLAEQLQVAHCVKFMGYTSEPTKAFASGVMSFMVSEFEGLPMSAQESLSAGTPVVAYDLLYGPKEYIVDGVNGVLVPNGDIDMLANATIGLLRNPEQLKRMSEAASALDERFSLPYIRKRWEKVLEDLESRHVGQKQMREDVLGECVLRNYKLFGIGSQHSKIMLIADRLQSERCRYYLNFNGELSIELTDKLYLEGKIVQTKKTTDYVLFDLDENEGVYAVLFMRVNEIALDVSYQQDSVRYPVSCDSIGELPDDVFRDLGERLLRSFDSVA